VTFNGQSNTLNTTVEENSWKKISVRKFNDPNPKVTLERGVDSVVPDAFARDFIVAGADRLLPANRAYNAAAFAAVTPPVAAAEDPVIPFLARYCVIS